VNLKMRDFNVQAINDEILGKLSLKNRYSFLNTNMMALLDDKQKKLASKVQRFCIKMDKEVNHTKDDVYNWIPAFGKEGFVTRSREFKELGLEWNTYWGLSAEVARALCVDMFNPEFNMGMGATVLCINPIAEHHENMDHRLKALKELVCGEAVGGICITEPEVGSDAVHLTTIATPDENGGFTVNGEKIYNTNLPKSKYAVFYGTTESKNAEKMMQGYFEIPKEGCKIDRVGVPWVPHLYLGREKFENMKIDKDHVLGGTGKGRDHLFEGLVPERMGIAILDLAEMWNAFTHAAIYANLRKQFGNIILL